MQAPLVSLLLVLASQVAVALGVGNCAYTYTAPAGYTLAFEDQFDTDLSKWDVW
jgi:hypothetical protein